VGGGAQPPHPRSVTFHILNFDFARDDDRVLNRIRFHLVRTNREGAQMSQFSSIQVSDQAL